ncbi:MAG: hypothetical protein ACRDJE_25105 [Dehalococcoidia bacterium]
MSQAQLLEELRRLPVQERLAVVETTLHELRQEIGSMSPETSRADASDERRRWLRAAALAALPLYEDGGELTAFTSLDGEPFHDHEEG